MGLTSLAQVVRGPAWRGDPLRCSWRLASSLVRRRVPRLRQPVVSFDGGRSRVVADLGTALGLRLYRYGVSEPELDLIRVLARPGDLVVDAGANLGLFTLVAAAAVGPSGRVLACEPAPQMAATLERNLALSGFSWAEVRRVALAERAGTAEFVVCEGDGSGFSSFAPPPETEGRVEQVAITTLDALVPPEDRPRLALVKVDVEGAELRLLQGGTEVLATGAPDMVIEVEPEHLSRQGASVGELRALLEGAGYRGYAVSRPDGSGVALTAAPDWERPRPTANLFLTTRPERARAAGVVVEEG